VLDNSQHYADEIFEEWFDSSFLETGVRTYLKQQQRVAIISHPQPYWMLAKHIRTISIPHKATWFESWNVRRANWIVTATRWNTPIKKYPFLFITEGIQKQILQWHISETELNIPKATRWGSKRNGGKETRVIWTCSIKYVVS
jgi:hypothetical protein